MASYDLRCRACGRDFEVFVRGFLKDEAKVCPDCGCRDIEQRFTGFQACLPWNSTGRAGGAHGGEGCLPSGSFG